MALAVVFIIFSYAQSDNRMGHDELVNEPSNMIKRSRKLWGLQFVLTSPPSYIQSRIILQKLREHRPKLEAEFSKRSVKVKQRHDETANMKLCRAHDFHCSFDCVL